MYTIKSNYSGKQQEYETLVEAIRDQGVLKIEKQANGSFRLIERCDEFFYIDLKPDQLKAWAKELEKMANES